MFASEIASLALKVGPEHDRFDSRCPRSIRCCFLCVRGTGNQVERGVCKNRIAWFDGFPGVLGKGFAGICRQIDTALVRDFQRIGAARWVADGRPRADDGGVVARNVRNCQCRDASGVGGSGQTTPFMADRCLRRQFISSIGAPDRNSA